MFDSIAFLYAASQDTVVRSEEERLHQATKLRPTAAQHVVVFWHPPSRITTDLRSPILRPGYKSNPDLCAALIQTPNSAPRATNPIKNNGVLIGIQR
jgi:hypothetical protein